MILSRAKHCWAFNPSNLSTNNSREINGTSWHKVSWILEKTSLPTMAIGVKQINVKRRLEVTHARKQTNFSWKVEKLKEEKGQISPLGKWKIYKH
jgi:hypothetical protein